ncbi:glycosyltransferase [Salicibibacter kimchii]|uniref:Glycosyltransferase n=1 Tax=Salicibibacter kimchii TaxID=2099786 RepID=A0A345BWI0_9BACI|nr:glycosyltransferase [Salicibibacter kimchii]AXF55311.1 glycosyltransferase [Salicibibacter kimchii]
MALVIKQLIVMYFYVEREEKNLLVSIITVYFNREDNVIDSINSLLSQTHKDLEIIAVDDGSSDNTLKKLESFSDKRLQVITHRNQGFVKSIKKAIHYANGEFIAIHGSGDLSHSARIEKQLDILINNKEIGIVGCFVESINKLTGKIRHYRSQIPDNSSLIEFLKKENPFTHGEVMYRRTVYNQVGGYREFFKYAQDRDLWMRMSLITHFYIVPEVLYTRFNLPGGVSTNADKVVMQRMFNEISRQCIDQKVKGNPDLIEKHGFYAPFFRRRNSKQLSDDLVKQAGSSFMKSDLNMAHKINILSIDEKRTIKNIIAFIVIIISMKSNPFKKVSQLMIRNTIINK